ncbi:MAG: hypothetical protein KZQ92_00850 [Candidatus Thiodiazotropha sp. (ex Lucinoma borealis)]|nr:hypothetical protein [Candidatus Thiodiazotropha sp. (ex Lucinoma borealis)]
MFDKYTANLATNMNDCDPNGRGKLVICLIAGKNRKFAPIFNDPSAGRVGFRASSSGSTGRRLFNDLTILDRCGEKGVYFTYTPRPRLRRMIKKYGLIDPGDINDEEEEDEQLDDVG